ncbi:MAG TPA: alpha/beta hydrolase [Thermoanaerobaculia bacterium]
MPETWFEREGVRLFAVEAGTGRAIVMLHGGMSSHLSSLPFLVPLIPRYRVLAPDLRGSGQSHYGGLLSFDQLADDVEALLDHLGIAKAVIGGASGGSGVALRFALRHPDRTAGLVLIHPVYGGAERGYTVAQKETFAGMGALASRALAEGVGVLRPLYENLPPAIREKALAMMEEFDAASVVATSRFVASGEQPFGSATELEALTMPVLLVPGDDPIHPAEVSELYAAHLPEVAVVRVPVTEAAAAIEAFCERIDPW